MSDENKLSRRKFMKNAAVAGAAVASAGVLGTTSAQAQTQSPATGLPDKWDYDVDVLVAGAGNGGLSAALTAAAGKAKTLLIEVSGVSGGSSLVSGGQLHTRQQRNWADYNKYSLGLHDQVLAKAFVETFWNELVPFLKSQNAFMAQPDPTLDYYMGTGVPLTSEALTHTPHRDYFDSLEKAIKANGGTILFKTRALKLYSDANGKVVGMQAKVWSGSPLEPNQKLINIKAKKTILSTGNFYLNKEMLTKYIGADADMIQNYGMSPYQNGEGHVMAQAAGAKMSVYLNGWSGGTIVATPTRRICDDPEAYEKWVVATNPDVYQVTMNNQRPQAPFVWSGAAANAILVNIYGKRFWDESNVVLSGYRRSTYEPAHQPRGKAIVVADQAAYDADAKTNDDRTKLIKDLGGKVYTGATLEELATQLEAQEGMYKGAFLKTVADYNKAIDSDKTEELDPPRTKQAKYFKIAKGPFYAVIIQSTIYCNFGGITINKDAQALDYIQAPIPNLYTVPPLGGGVMNIIYTGGIAMAGTFGYRAAKHAVANLNT